MILYILPWLICSAFNLICVGASDADSEDFASIAWGSLLLGPIVTFILIGMIIKNFRDSK